MIGTSKTVQANLGFAVHICNEKKAISNAY